MTLCQSPMLRAPLSLQAAVEIARQELIRLGLTATYHVTAIYADVDRRTEGAAFACIASPGAPSNAKARRGGLLPRLKLLIHEDGRATLRTMSARRIRHQVREIALEPAA